MAVEGDWDDPKYTGFSKYFNAYTIRGRSNWAKLWVSVYALAYIGYRLIRKGSANSTETAGPQSISTSLPIELSGPSQVENSQELDKSPETGILQAAENSSGEEEKHISNRMSQPENPPSNDSTLNLGAKISDSKPNTQHPYFTPNPCYPCFPPPYFFYPAPYPGQNPPPWGNYGPPNAYPHCPYPAPPNQTPQNSQLSSSLQQQEYNSATSQAPTSQNPTNCPIKPPSNNDFSINQSAREVSNNSLQFSLSCQQEINPSDAPKETQKQGCND